MGTPEFGLSESIDTQIKSTVILGFLPAAKVLLNIHFKRIMGNTARAPCHNLYEHHSLDDGSQVLAASEQDQFYS